MIIQWNHDELRRRNAAIAEKLKKFTEEMTREPGAKDRCRKYLLENFPDIWNEDGTLKD